MVMVIQKCLASQEKFDTYQLRGLGLGHFGVLFTRATTQHWSEYRSNGISSYLQSNLESFAPICMIAGCIVVGFASLLLGSRLWD
jgi:hypothetical protein